MTLKPTHGAGSLDYHSKCFIHISPVAGKVEEMISLEDF